MQTNFDAIIIGAGPAGSTAAILLARAGWSVALVEKQRFPRRKVCGECIAASNLPLLEALGIGIEFDAHAGPPLHQVALMQRERTIIANLPPAEFLRHSWGRALGRETLDTLLLEQARLARTIVLQPWTVESMEGLAGDHRCEIRSIESGKREILRAPVLIAANGSWESLPSGRATRRLGRRPSDLFAFKANFRGSALTNGLLPVLSFKGGYGGMVVAGDGITTLACCIRSDRLEALRHEAPGMRAGDVVENALKQDCRGVAEALGPARREGEWLASGPIAPGIRLRYDDEHFRIGNAAGEAHPIIGEGMSMAIQSAWLLCSHLIFTKQGQGIVAKAAWHQDVGHQYRADWRRHFAPRLRIAALFAHLAMRPAVSAPLFSMLSWAPPILTKGALISGKIRCAVDLETVALLAAGMAH